MAWWWMIDDFSHSSVWNDEISPWSTRLSPLWSGPRHCSGNGDAWWRVRVTRWRCHQNFLRNFLRIASDTHGILWHPMAWSAPGREDHTWIQISNVLSRWMKHDETTCRMAGMCHHDCHHDCRHDCRHVHLLLCPSLLWFPHQNPSQKPSWILSGEPPVTRPGPKWWWNAKVMTPEDKQG